MDHLYLYVGVNILGIAYILFAFPADSFSEKKFCSGTSRQISKSIPFRPREYEVVLRVSFGAVAITMEMFLCSASWLVSLNHCLASAMRYPSD
jgi:hypothetical protein